MTCQVARRSISAHLDGRLPGGERQQLEKHLASCAGCESEAARMSDMRRSLRQLPAMQPSEHLKARLRVVASHERNRRIALKTPSSAFAYYMQRLELWSSNLMRPVALPFAGGLTSAILLFATLVPSVAFRMVPGADVPMALYTRASVKTTPDLSFGSEDLVIQLTVDERGRMTDYTVENGYEDLTRNPELRRTVENYLVFTEFEPATTFGQPTPGKIRISLSRKQIDVKS